LFQVNIFYPYPHSLAYNEHLLPAAAVFLPLHLIFGDSMIAYQLLNLLTFVLCGFGGYLLGRRVTRSYWGGIIAGIIFAFCPYKMSQIHHFQILSAQWFPFTLLFLDRSIERGRPRDLLLLGLFISLQVLSCGYYGLFLVVGIGLVTPFLLLGHHWRKWRRLWERLWRLALAGLATGALILPFYLPYTRATELTEGGRRSVGYVAQLSPDMVNYLAAPASNRLYGDITAPLRKEPEGSMLPGITVVVLSIAGVVVGLRKRRPAAVGGMLALLALTLGAGLFSLGPTIHLAGNALIRGPYIFLYRYVPGFAGVRVPGRFAVLVMLGLSVLAAIGAKWLLGRMRSPARPLFALGVVVLLGVEFASFPLPVDKVDLVGPPPAVYQWLADQPDDFAIVELPIDVYPSFEYDIPYMVQSTHHWKRLVNGHTSNFPAGHLTLTEILQEFPDESGVQALRALNVRYVLVHRDLFPADALVRFDSLASQPLAGMTLAGTFDNTDVYRLEPPTEEYARIDLGTVEDRQFLLNGWSFHDDMAAGKRFVWTTSTESAVLMPAWSQVNQTLTIEARTDAPSASCRLAFDGVDLGACVFSDAWSECRVALPDAAPPALYMLNWNCDLPEMTTGREIGATGVDAPRDLAVAAAGASAGDYADLYVEGKRYSTDRDCPTCIGLLMLQVGNVGDPLWWQVDMNRPEQVADMLARLRDAPAGTVLLAAARSDAGPLPAMRAALAQYGAGDVWAVRDSAYLFIGVQGAPAGAAIERACGDGCVEYLGQRWPKLGVAVSRMEIGP